MGQLTLNQLQQQVTVLQQQLQQTLERVGWLERVFEAYGIRGLWLSPAKAAPLLGISRDRIMSEIERAEALRHQKRKGDLVYGKHYRNIQDPQAEQGTWQVHVANFDAILLIPPDQRKID